MHKLAVIGNPVNQSLSPEIFTLFAQQTDIELEYSKILADADTFEKLLKNFFIHGGMAINVTSPFKSLAYLNVQNRTCRANLCKASNFIRVSKSDKLIADTTDGIGLVTALQLYQKYNIEDKNILIIGSGSVVDSILLDIIVKNPYKVDILARNEQRVEYLKDKFGVGYFNNLLTYNLIINTTPNVENNSLFNMIQQNIDKYALCYDLSYQKKITNFHKIILRNKPEIFCINGLGMLIEQAAVAFKKLFSISINTAPIFEKLNNKE